MIRYKHTLVLHIKIKWTKTHSAILTYSYRCIFQTQTRFSFPTLPLTAREMWNVVYSQLTTVSGKWQLPAKGIPVRHTLRRCQQDAKCHKAPGVPASRSCTRVDWIEVGTLINFSSTLSSSPFPSSCHPFLSLRLSDALPYLPLPQCLVDIEGGRWRLGDYCERLRWAS